MLLALIVIFLCVDRPVKAEKKIADRIAAGKTVPVTWYVTPWLWKGLIANIGLATLLVALTPLARRKLGDRWKVEAPPRTLVKWEKIILIGVIGIAAVQNAPRLSHSLWGDEEYTGRRLIADDLDRDENGKLTIEKQSWLTTFWSFRKPTNHIGYTVIARAVHDTFFQPKLGPTDPWFSETLIRLPVYVAGLLSILTLVWACRVWGFGNGAVLLAFGYIMHPWFVRFGVDARGYGFVLMYLPLMLALLGRALQTGRWSFWILLGLAQFHAFWTYFGLIYFLVTFHLAAVLMMWTAKGWSREDRTVMFTRWFVANLMSVMLIVGIEAPCLPQFFEFMSQKVLAGEMDKAWFADAIAYVISGVPWYPWDPSNPLCNAWTHPQNGSSALFIGAPLIVVGVLVAIIVGTREFWSESRRRWLLLVVFGAPSLMLVHQALSHIRPYHWYLIPYIPGFCMVAAAFIARLMPFDGNVAIASRNRMLAGFVVLPLLAIQLVGSQERRLLTQHPIEPCRESVALTRQITNPRHPDYDNDVITVAFAFTSEAYDPGQTKIAKGEELRALMARADKEGKRLFVNFGHKAWAVMYFPDIVSIIDDPALFEHTATLPGLFLASTREVYRYKGTAAAK